MHACFAPSTYTLKTKFNADEAKWIKERGNANIIGQAFLNQKGGTVVTCAGQEVYLTPVNSYSSERMNAIYKSTEKGYLGYYLSNIVFEPSTPQEYYTLAKKSICDAQGNFKFNNIKADKEYFITTKVTWEVSVIEGGYLMLKVKPKDNETLEVILN